MRNLKFVSICLFFLTLTFVAVYLSLWVFSLSDGKNTVVSDEIITMEETIQGTDVSFHIIGKGLNGTEDYISFNRDGTEIYALNEYRIDAVLKDINGDNQEEVLLSLDAGGNCCAAKLSLFYVNTETQVLERFDLYEWAEFWGGWNSIVYKLNKKEVVMTIEGLVEKWSKEEPDRIVVVYRFDGKGVQLVSESKFPYQQTSD